MAGSLGRRYRIWPYVDPLASFQYLGNLGDILALCFQGRTRKRFYETNVPGEIRGRVLDDAKCEGVT